MKQELPFAVALLAAGCLLCFSQFSGPSNSTAKIPTVSVQTADLSQSVGGGSHEGDESGGPFAASTEETGSNDEPYAVAQTSYQEHVERDQDQSQINPPMSARPATKSPLDPDLYVHQASNPKAVSFLAELAKQIADSQPHGSTNQLTGNLFDQVVSASGDYYQMGKGSHKSRIELVFGTSANSPSVIQLCDGRFVYKFQSSSDKRSLEFVDLSRVRKTAGERGSGIAPSGWVASGGIASLFQHLASAFNFGELELGDQSSVTMRGSWDDNALRQIVGVVEDLENTAEDRAKRLNQIPAQLPHAVELIFRRDKNLNYFPKRIKFLRFEESDNVTELSPMVVLEFSAPRPLPNFSDRYFVVDSTGLDPIDMTEHYIARIIDFDRLERTAESDETLDR
jgi:hypothetical protein